MAKGKYQEWLTDEGLLRLEAWARDGLTNEQIASKIGVSRKTLQEWCVKYGDIRDTLKKGKEIVDIEVENSLLKRALGYKSKEVKTVESAKGMVTTTIEKDIPPDVTACIIWLKNRRPDKWRDKPTEKSNSEENQHVVFEIVAVSQAKRDEDDKETASD